MSRTAAGGVPGAARAHARCAGPVEEAPGPCKSLRATGRGHPRGRERAARRRPARGARSASRRWWGRARSSRTVLERSRSRAPSYSDTRASRWRSCSTMDGEQAAAASRSWTMARIAGMGIAELAEPFPQRRERCRATAARQRRSRARSTRAARRLAYSATVAATARATSVASWRCMSTTSTAVA